MSRPKKRWKVEKARNRVVGYIHREGKPAARPTLALLKELESLSEQEVSLLLAERYQKALLKYEDGAKKVSPTRFSVASQIYINEKIWSGDTQPYESTFQKLIDIVGDFELAAWDNKLNKKFVQACEAKKLSDATINKHQRHLQSCFNWLHEYRDDLLEKPIKIQKKIITTRIKQPDGEPTVWSADQINTYRRVIDDTGNLNYMRVFMLARYQIMRLGEIWSLPIQRIDLKNGFIIIDNVQDFPREGKLFRVKKKQTRKIEIHPTLLQWLRYDMLARQPEEKWFLDDGHGRPAFAYSNSVSAAFRKLRNAAGLKGDPLHCLRRTGITEMLANDVPAVKVMALAGHYSIDTTLASYVNRSALEGSQALAKIS